MSGLLLVADSGSTKTDWCLTDGEWQKTFSSAGLNPYQLAPDELRLAVLSAAEWSRWEVTRIRFYGAGCTPEKVGVVEAALRRAVSMEADVRVADDMLGAARSVLGDEPGLVGILGTGSNSCCYDGHEIVAHVPALGYVLGDEGSGAYIGRRLVGNCLKHQFADDLCRAFAVETGLSAASVVQRVYREPQPNRFLASLVPFCQRHREHPQMHAFLVDCFRQFFQRNVALYGRAGQPVHFVGGVAHTFRTELQEAAQAENFRLGRVEKAPLQGIVLYELSKNDYASKN